MPDKPADAHPLTLILARFSQTASALHRGSGDLDASRLPRTLARMRFVATIDIAAAAQLVYEVNTDVERWPEWAASVERLDQGPLRVGSRARIKQTRFPAMVWEVTQVVTGRSFSWTQPSPVVPGSSPRLAMS
jgi:hypothetical protein